MDTTDDNILLALYTLFWVISFIVYHYRNRHIDGGSAVMASYIVYCLHYHLQSSYIVVMS